MVECSGTSGRLDLEEVSRIPGTGVLQGPTQSQRSQSFLKPLCGTEDERDL